MQENSPLEHTESSIAAAFGTSPQNICRTMSAACQRLILDHHTRLIRPICLRQPHIVRREALCSSSLAPERELSWLVVLVVELCTSCASRTVTL